MDRLRQIIFKSELKGRFFKGFTFGYNGNQNSVKMEIFEQL